MYATSPNTVDTADYLRTVQIDHIDERLGQMIRTALKRRLHPTRANVAYQYSLKLTVSESISQLAIEKDASTTRANLTLSANYELIRLADSRMLHTGSVRGVASYNILASHYASASAEKNARTRAVESVADQLKTQIAVYFNGPGLKQPPLGQMRTVQ